MADNVLAKSNIYVITVMEKCEPGKLFANFGATRVIAYYFNYEQAYYSVTKNIGDMWETCYDYAVIEEVAPGMYPDSEVRQFFKYDKSNDTYQPIDEPECVNHVTNFSIG